MFMKPMHRAMALLGTMGLMVSACNNAPPVPIDDVVNAVHVEMMSSQGSNQIDVLFVIANSTSVDEERVMLEEAFPGFVRGLLDINADFHIGVITPDMQTHSERGALHIGPNASPDAGALPMIYESEDPISCTDSTDCLLELPPHDPLDPQSPVRGGGASFQGTCNPVEVDDGNGGTVATNQCFYTPRFCTAPPSNLLGCNDRFVPLMVGGEQVTCDHNPNNCSYTSYSPHWEKRCDDLNNAQCMGAEGPVGERRCTAAGVCEIKPAFLRASDYADESVDGVNDEQVIDDFACMSAVGTCHISASTYPERGLDAVYEALKPGSNLNKGFLRDDALLLVVFVSDDDDCSVGVEVNGESKRARLSSEQCWGEGQDPLLEISELYDFITTQVKRSPSQVMTAAIVGPVPLGFVWSGHEYSCSQAGDTTGTRLATAGDRYTRFVRSFGHRGVVGSICEADFDPVLAQVTRAVSRSLGQTCLSSPPKACNPDSSDCGAGAECVQAAPPRVLMRSALSPELGRDDADPALDGEVACTETEECLLGDADDDSRACNVGRCSIGGDILTCSTTEDCIPPGTDEQQRGSYVCDQSVCYQGDIPPGTSPRFVCDDFEVIIEASSDEENWRRLVGPGNPAELDYVDDHDYQINYYANEACPATGVGFRFVNAPAVDDRVRLSYPVSLRDQIFN